MDSVWADDIISTVGGLNNLIYGIAAGLAVLMIVIHAVRWKTADNLADREQAKKGIINVILALILIMVAGAVISVIYVKPPEAEPPSTTRVPTTRAPPTTFVTTTSTTTTTTTSTTTTIPESSFLTAANLAKCINNKGGIFYTLGASCPGCVAQKGVWEREKNPPVGPGAPALASIRQESSGSVCGGGYPCWKYKSSGQTGSDAGCRTFSNLNKLYNCGLIPVSGHTYQSC